MESSQISDIIYSKNTTFVKKISPTGQPLIVDNFTLKLHNTPKFNQDNLIVQKDQQYAHQNKTIRQLQASKPTRSYLNLQNTQPPRIREVLNKYVVENDIKFITPQNQSIIHYHIEFDQKSQKIQFILVIYQNNPQFFVDDQYIQHTTCELFVRGENLYVGNQFELCNAFIDFIGSVPKICIMVGFKMTSGTNMVFEKILSTLFGNQYTMIKKYGVKSQESKNDMLLKYVENIQQLESVYFIDSQVLIFESLKREQKINLMSNHIESYVMLFVTEQLITRSQSQNSQQLKDQLNNQFNQLNSIQQVLSKTHLIDKKIGLISLLQVPLNYALYETTVSCIQQYLMREYYKQGYMFMFDYIGDQSESLDQSYKGGLIEHIEEPLQYQILKNEVRGDFFSLYATVIASKNISHETLHKQQLPAKQSIEIDLNYQSVNSTDYQEGLLPNPVWFDQTNKGIIPNIVEQLLQQRQSTQDPLEKANLKIVLASIYGLIGQKISPFYSFECASAVCAYSRQACDVARYHILNTLECYCQRITVRNTDSVSYILKTDNFGGAIKKPQTAYAKLLSKGWSILNEKIQTELKSKLFEFKLEEDQFALYALYSHQKKAYVRVICDINLFIKAKDSQLQLSQLTSASPKDQCLKLEIKGPFSWTSYSQQRIQQNKSMFVEILQKQILTSNDDLQTKILAINNLIVQKESIEFDQISKLIQTQRIDSLQEYTTFLRYSEDDKRCDFLRKTYNVKSATFIIPYLDESPQNQKLINNNIIPINLVNTQNCNRIIVNSLVKEYFNPIKLFFNVKKQDTRELKSYQLDKNIKLLDDECQIRLESQYKVNDLVKISRKFQIFKYYDIEYTIQQSPNISFHEIISRKINKMYFDVDSPIQIRYEQIYRCINDGVQKINQYIQGCPKIHIANAHKTDTETQQIIKWSYHIVVDIECHISTNEYIAKQMNLLLKKQLKIEDPKINPFDVQVYNSNESSATSMRLPNCIKFDKNQQPENRKFEIESQGSSFVDFIINKVSTCSMKMNKCILFDPKSPIFVQPVNMRFSQDDIQIILNHLKQITNIQQWQTQIKDDKNIVLLQCNRKIQCPVCKRTHDKEHLYMIKLTQNKYLLNCYQNKKNTADYKQPISLETQQLVQVKDKTFGLRQLSSQINAEDFSDIATTTVQMRYIQFQIQNNINYIISDLGTGKSQHLKGFLDEALKENSRTTILCLSFRRTFSIEFAKKYGLENYMDIKGELSAQTNPKLILQMDSLVRYNVSLCPTYLIIDEIESILEKIPSCNDYQGVISNFVTLLRNCEKVIIMDGLMEKKTIEYINLIRNTDNFNVVYNLEAPRSDYNFLIYKYQTNDIVFVCDMILKMVQDGKNVYGMITSKSQGKMVKEILQQHGIKCIFYSGDDAHVEIISTDEGLSAISQLEIKNEHFQNVDLHWKQFQVVLHNSAITAGISFSEEHFDYQVNVFNSGTCSSLSFFQGIHRVRNIKSKQIITFIEEDYCSDFYTPQQFTDLQYQLDRDFDVTISIDLSINKQIETWLSAREGCANRFRTQLLFKYIKKMKYQVQIMEYPEDYVRSSLDSDDNLYTQMESIPLLSEDLDLGEREMLESYLMNKDNSIENLKSVQSKLTKIDLMYKYNMNIEQINSLDFSSLKILHKAIHVQKMRIEILKTYGLRQNDITDTEWLQNKMKEYAQRRNYHTYSNQELQIIGLSQFLLHIRSYLQSEGMDLQVAKEQLLKDPRITPYKKVIKVNKRTKPLTLLDNLFTLFFMDIMYDGSSISFELLDIKKEHIKEQDPEVNGDVEDEY